MNMTMTRYRHCPQRLRRLIRCGTGLRLAIGLFAITPMWSLVWTLQSVAAPGELDQRLKEERQELKEVKDQIKGYKSRLDQTKRRERNVVQTLEESDRLLQQKQRELQVNERNLKLQADKHAALVKQMDELTSNCRRARGIFIPACVPS
jgi:phage-related minor tail protein